MSEPLQMTPEQADKLNRAMAGEKVDLSDEEAALMNQALGHAPEKAPEAQPVPSEPEALSPKSMSGTALRSFGKGASFGFSDELAGLQGAGEEIGGRLGLPMQTTEHANSPLFEALAARYRGERNATRKELTQGAAANPKTAMAAELAGAAVAPTKGLGSLRGLGAAQKVGRFAGQGLQMGGMSALGNSEADVTKGDVGEALADTGKGALIGAGAGAVLGPVFDAAGNTLESALRAKAENKVLEAINNPGITDKFAKLGIAGEAARREFARKALNSGLIKFGDDAAAIEARADEFANRWGSVVGDVTNKADAMNEAMMQAAAARNAEKVAAHNAQATSGVSLKDAKPLAELEPVRSAVDTKAVAQAMRAKLGERTNVEQMGSGPTEDLISRIETEPRQTFDALRRSKSSAQGAVNWSEQAPQSKEIFRDVTGELRNQFLKQIEPVVGPDEMEMLRLANEQYGHASDLATIAGDKASREAGKSPIGVKQLAQGAAASEALGGGIPGAIANTAVSTLSGAASRRLPASTAAAAEAAAVQMRNLPSPLAKAAEFESLQRYLTPEQKEKKSADDFRAAMTGQAP